MIVLGHSRHSILLDEWMNRWMKDRQIFPMQAFKLSHASVVLDSLEAGSRLENSWVYLFMTVL